MYLSVLLQLAVYTDCSIRECQSIFIQLSSTPAYYAFYYVGIFDAGLIVVKEESV